MENPACDCVGYQFSRLQVCGRDCARLVRGELFYTCAVGGCNFFRRCETDEGRIWVYKGAFDTERMRNMGL